MLVDGGLAAVLAFLGVASGVAMVIQPGSSVTGISRVAGIPLALLLAVPVIFRRSHPVAAFGAAVAIGGIQVLLNIRPNATDLVIVILLYTLAAYTPRRTSVTGLAICLVGSAVAVARWMPGQLSVLDAIAVGSIMFAGPSLIAWVFGDSMRYRRAYYTSLEDRAARLEAERDAQAQIAAAAERARIARELHDVVAHNVSVMVVQADGASYALGSDPDRARQALAAISATGRQALTEMRRMLGVLRRDEDGPEPERAPLPGIGQLGELLEQTRATGLAVSFTVEGVPQPLPDGAALAAYRIVQESLTNTRKHGGPGATAQVTLRYLEDALLLRITDDGQGAGASLRRGRPRADRDARAGGHLRRLGAGRPAPVRRLPGDGAAAADTLRARHPRASIPRAGIRCTPRGARGRQACRCRMSIRIVLVDDQELVRAGFRMVLDAQPDMEVVGEAGDGLAATQLLRTVAADVAVMDVRMPRLDGIEATRQICRAGDRPRVLMLTTFDLDEYAYSALKAGASGFLLKDVPPEELLFAHPGGALRRRGGRPVHHPAADRPFRAAVPGRRRPGPAGPRLPDRARAGGTRPRRPGPVQRRDRGAAVRVRGHREDPCRPGAGQARPA